MFPHHRCRNPRIWHLLDFKNRMDDKKCRNHLNFGRWTKTQVYPTTLKQAIDLRRRAHSLLSESLSNHYTNTMPIYDIALTLRSIPTSTPPIHERGVYTKSRSRTWPVTEATFSERTRLPPQPTRSSILAERSLPTITWSQCSTNTCKDYPASINPSPG